MSANGDVRVVDPVNIRGDISVVLRGEDGLSAYEVAVKNGFEGTEEEWLESLKGEAARAEAYTHEAEEYWHNAQASAIQSGNSAVEAARYRNEAQDIRDAFAPEVADARAAIQAEKEEAEQKKLLVDDAAANAHLDREQADADAAEVRYLYNETIFQKNVATDAAERARRYAQGAGGYASEAQQHSQEAEGFAQQAQAREEQCTVLWENMKTFPDTARLYMEEAGHSATLASQEADKAHSSAVLASQEAYQAGQIRLDMLNYGETLRQDMDACESRTEGYSIQAKDYADLAGASAEMVQDKIDTSVAEAVTEQLAGKLDVNGKAVDSAHADSADDALHAGDADTVNGHTVETSVPPNAVFTDTTYEVMASSELEDGASTQGRLIDAHTLATFILTVAADVVNNAPEALDTLAELAQALGNDPNFATTVMNVIGQKLDKTGGVVTGDLTVNGTFTGNVTGNVSGSSGSCTGNAATATKATQDKNGNDIVNTYIDKTSTQTISGKKTFTGETHIYSDINTTSGQGLYVHGSGAIEGGQINLCAPDQGTAYNGLFLDNCLGTLRLIGIPSADGKSKTGIGRILNINPYEGTITGGYTFTGNVTGNCSGSSGSCTGNSATATIASALSGFVNSNSASPQDCNNITTNGLAYYVSNGPATSLGASTNDGGLFSQMYNGTWGGQIAQDYRNGSLFVRGKNSGSWTAWKRMVWNEGTWGINITGKATTAGTADNSNKLGGYPVALNSHNGPTWGGIPVLKNDGVTEIGRYLDFHTASAEAKDYSARLEAVNGQLNSSCNIAAPSFLGQIQQTSLTAGFKQIAYCDYGVSNCGGMRIGFDAYSNNTNEETGKLDIDVRGARSRVAIRQWTDWSHYVREVTVLDPNGNSNFPGEVQAQRLRCYGIQTAANLIFDNASIVLREKEGVSTGQSDFTYAPSIGFHWGGICAGSLSMHSDNKWYLRKQDGTSRATLDADIQGNCTGNAATATKINGKTVAVVSSFSNGVLALTGLS